MTGSRGFERWALGFGGALAETAPKTERANASTRGHEGIGRAHADFRQSRAKAQSPKPKAQWP
jgi:hypothetical protein